MPCPKCGRKRIVSVVAETFVAADSVAQWHGEIVGDETNLRTEPDFMTAVNNGPQFTYSPPLPARRLCGRLAQ